MALVAALMLGARAASAACGDDGLEDVEECDDGNATSGDGCSATCQLECELVGDGATDHTCLHGSAGPFADRVASEYPGPSSQNVDPTHTYYTIVLPGEPGDNRGVIAFRPSAAKPYAIFMRLPYPLRLLDAEGSEVPMVIEHAIDSCGVPDSITWVRVFERLDTDVVYTLDIGPVDQPTVSVALESLGFEALMFRDGDLDGFGAGEVTAYGWCHPPAGFSTSSEDCDDADVSRYPGATEACDGTDSDCDGRLDPEENALCTNAPGGGLCLLRDDGSTACGCETADDCAGGLACVANQCEGASGAGGAGEGGAGATSVTGAGTDGSGPGAASGASTGAAPGGVDSGAGGATEDAPADDGEARGGCQCTTEPGSARSRPGAGAAVCAAALLASATRRRARSTSRVEGRRG